VVHFSGFFSALFFFFLGAFFVSVLVVFTALKIRLNPSGMGLSVSFPC